jgi:hypothetical protein
VVDQVLVARSIPRIIRRFCEFDELALRTLPHNQQHTVVTLSPGSAAVRDRRFAEPGSGEWQHDVDGDSWRGQRVFEQQKIGAGGRGTYHDPWAQYVDKPGQSPLQERYLTLREARRTRAIGTVNAVTRMDEDHQLAAPLLLRLVRDLNL